LSLTKQIIIKQVIIKQVIIKQVIIKQVIIKQVIMSEKQVVKLLKDVDLTFGKVRSTSSGSKMIDITNKELYQTGWMKVVNIEKCIIFDASEFSQLFKSIDESIINVSSKELDIPVDKLLSLYRNMLINDTHIRMSTGIYTVLFDSSKKYFRKEDIFKSIKVGDSARIIIRFKKLCYKDDCLKHIFELVQIETA